LEEFRINNSMSFAEYFVIKERFKPSRDDRFLAIAIDEKTWENYISEITSVWEDNDIRQPLRFVIADKSGSFTMYLDWNNNSETYSYKLEGSTIAWLSERGLNEDNSEERPWCYYDESKREFVIKGKTEKGNYYYSIKNNFGRDELLKFLEDLFVANGICEVKSKVTIVYVLYYIDKLSLEDSQTIKRNPSTPDWVEYSLKDDEFRGSSRGIFGSLFK